MACVASTIPFINLGEPFGEFNQLISLIPILNKITNTNKTNNTKANFATKLFDSKKSEVALLLLDVEKEY
jgi:hypothetical protein